MVKKMNINMVKFAGIIMVLCYITVAFDMATTNHNDIVALRQAMSTIVDDIVPASDKGCQKAWDEGWRPRGYWRTRKRKSARRTRHSTGIDLRTAPRSPETSHTSPEAL